ncbi:hypothetical protein pdam_00015266 [Pocillopora damicornis]|uniref:G-protein coupled receptors family 1 profile domain-containing protein n=1 Tax=Pocillopora damicornis TaxID=46731 RepID=A0A3M6UI12_POCDA|nr:hypothetical protein pdam_00015266 [Pocillopora damicornis]
MNRVIANKSLLNCGLPFISPDAAENSRAVYIVFISRTAINATTCPLIIFLNIMVMISVKTKQRLRTKSNITLACLATTDVLVGLIVQPLQIASAERYIGIHYPLRYSNMVTETRILLASGIAWIAAIILPTDYLRKTLSRPFLATLALLLRKTISEAKEIERRIFCSSGKIGESAFDQQPPVVGERGAN